MARLLYLEASPRKERSHSIHVAAALLASYREEHPADTVETVDLWSTELPPFDGATLAAKYAVLGGESFSVDQEAAWRRVVAMADQLKSADKLLIAAPMWNFSIPYPLKHYIDVVTQPGLTFGVDPEKGYFGMVTGKPACLVLASGGSYLPGSETAALDYQRSYLEFWLRFIGFERIETITVAGTLGGPEAVRHARQEAADRARAFAAVF